jgi:arabinofuranosyltransferase
MTGPKPLTYSWKFWLPTLTLFGAAIYLLIRSAWVSDDAYITFRVVDNFLNGYGLRWNTAERVQVYTHPLWMLMMVPVQAMFGDPMVPVMALGILMSLVSLGLLWRGGQARGWAIPVMVLLLSSKAFIDYGTSGLENPLSILLLILFLDAYHRKGGMKDWWLMGSLMGLAVLNRMDVILLFGPLMLWRGWELYREQVAPGKVISGLLVSAAPIVIWLLFAWIYYSYPLPNSYYAKVEQDFPTIMYLEKGILYFWDSFLNDRVTMLGLLGGLGLAFWKGKKGHMAIGIGMILYLVYICRVGGDFMSGRFFALPLAASAWLAMKGPTIKLSWGLGMAGVIMILALTVPSPTWFYNTSDGLQKITPAGVMDERMYYYQSTGLLTAGLKFGESQSSWADQGRKLGAENRPMVGTKIAVGFLGYYSGPLVHVIDILGVTDPLLARLPPKKTEDFRVGHIYHKVPEGYLESLPNGPNSIVDPEIHALYDEIRARTWK